MRVFWIGIGSLATLILAVVPYIAKERCKTRWAPAEVIWNYESGCMVKIRGSLIREDHISVSPVKQPSHD